MKLIPLAIVLSITTSSLVGCDVDEDEYSLNEDRADGVVGPDSLWPQGDVYIILNTDISWISGVRAALDNTTEELAANTGIRLHFIDDPSESPNGFYVRFDGRPWFFGGSAPIGVSTGGQAESDFSAVRHEVGHIVGMFHTHARPDRDEHVVVHEPYISEGWEDQFKRNGFLIGPYDTESIMHYASDTFSINSCATITILPEDTTPLPETCFFSDRSSNRIIENDRSEYTEWNYSTMAALYCDRRYCGSNCASEERCSAPKVREHLSRLETWENSPEGRDTLQRFPPPSRD